jgi:hypothetical protein
MTMVSMETKRGSITRRFAVVALLMTAVTMVAVAAEPTIEVSFAADRVIAEGLVPGADAVWLGVAHTRHGWDHRIQRIDRLVTDDDGDGRVELVWHEPLPIQSVWVVVDQASGRHAVATPPGMPLRPLELDTTRAIIDSGQLLGLTIPKRRYLEVMAVDPGLGTWGLTTGDGTVGDADGTANGEIRIEPVAMTALHTSPQAPEALAGSSLIIVIDACNLEVGVVAAEEMVR